MRAVPAALAYLRDWKSADGLSAPEFNRVGLRRAVDEMNQVLVDLADRTHAHLFDFAAVMPTEERYFVDHIHTNAQGAALKARLFADYLTENVLAP